MLGVSGAKSFSGFMVAAPGAPRSPATPQPAAARAAPEESAAPRCLRRRLMDHAALVLPVSLRRLAPSRNPGFGPRPRTPVPGRLTAHATRSRPAPAVLKGQRPCYTDHVTLQPLPPSASRSVPSPATPPHAGCRCVVPAPIGVRLLPSRPRVAPDGACRARGPGTQVPSCGWQGACWASVYV